LFKPHTASFLNGLEPVLNFSDLL